MDKSYFIELTNKLYRLTLFFPQKEPLRDKVRGTADEILSDLTIILEGVKHEKREAAFRVERNLQILDTLLELSKRQHWIETEEIERVQENYTQIRKEVEEFNDMSRRQMLRRGIGREMQNLIEADISKGGETPFTSNEKKEENYKKEQESQERREEPSRPERTSPRSEAQQTRPHSQEKKPSEEQPSNKKATPPQKDETKLNKRQKKILGVLRKKGGKMQVRDFQEILPDATKRTLRRDLSEMVEKKFIKRTGKGNTTYYMKV